MWRRPGLGNSFGVDVVAGRAQFLVGAGVPVVGEVVGLRALWVVLTIHSLLLVVHGELWTGGVGWWAVVVVVVGVVLRQMVVVVVVEVVAGALVPLAVDTRDAASKIVLNLPEFTGKDLSEFAESFGRFLRMTGQTHASGWVNSDQLMQCWRTNYLEKQVKRIMTKSATFAEVLVALGRQYSSYDTDLSIRTEIWNLAMLPNNPKAARISELLANLDHWVGRLTPRSDGRDEMLFWLVAKIPRDVCDECWATGQRLASTLTYEDLSVLLLPLALEKESDQILNAYRPG